MDSDFGVFVSTIENIKPHENADKLEIATIKGWQVVVPIGAYKAGDHVLYVPIDAVVPLEISDKWGVTQYLHRQKVRAARLRGEMSFGFIAPIEEINGSIPEINTDVSEFYGIIKYVPQDLNVRLSQGEAEKQNPKFFKYTKIYNYRNFPDIFIDGESVVATEKLHGTSTRGGIVSGEETEKYCVGSHNVQKRIGSDSLYEMTLSAPGVEACLNGLHEKTGGDVIIYGEIFGYKIQDLQYDLKTVEVMFFDISINGEYMDYGEFLYECAKYGIKHVPLIYSGPFNEEKLWGMAAGKSTIANHIKEGIVIKPGHERTDPSCGRVILKMISNEYLLRKNGTEYN